MNKKFLNHLFIFFFLTSAITPRASAQTPLPQDPRAAELGKPIDISEEDIIIHRTPPLPQPFQILLKEPPDKNDISAIYQAQEAFLSLAEAKLGRKLEVVKQEIIESNYLTLNLLKSEIKQISRMEGVLRITPLGDSLQTEPDIFDTVGDAALDESRSDPLPVTKTISQDLANVGDTLTYTITIPSNRTGVDLTYQISDTLPVGVTYIPYSLETFGSEIGAAYDELTNTIIWEGIVPDFVLRYDMSDNTSNPDYCRMPLGDGSYYDIYSEDGFPSYSNVSGDGIAFELGILGEGTEFYGDVIPYLPRFTDDGYVLMTAGENYSHPYYYQRNTVLPDPSLPNGLLSLWWDDMVIIHDETLNKGVTAIYLTDAFLVEFDDIEDFWLGYSMDFEVFAYQEPDPAQGYPDIIFAYDNILGDWFTDDGNYLEDPLPIPGEYEGSVGIENPAGTMGSTHMYNEAVPQNGDIVCFDYVEIGRDPVVISFDVTVNDALISPENIPGKTITNTAEVILDAIPQSPAEATFTINDVPVADPQTLSTDEDIPLALLLSGSDTYNNQPLIYKITQPENGVALAGEGGLPNVNYTPDENWYGIDSFTFTVGDGVATSEPVIITITVAPVNDPPTLTAIPDQQIRERTTLSLNISASDPDVPVNILTFNLLNPPMGAVIDPSSGIFSWTPTEEQGPEKYDITIEVCDDGEPILCAQEEFTITVTEPVFLPLISR